MAKIIVAELTVADLLIHPDPIVRCLIQQIINRLKETEKEDDRKED